MQLHHRHHSTAHQVQLVMATATLTKGVRALLDDVSSSASAANIASAPSSSRGYFNIEFADPTNKTPRKLDGSEERVRMKIVEVDGLHRSLPHVRHTGPSFLSSVLFFILFKYACVCVYICIRLGNRMMK